MLFQMWYITKIKNHKNCYIDAINFKKCCKIKNIP